MAFVLRPGKYLIEKTRRQTVGVIAHVGTGGSVPAPVQKIVDDFAHQIASQYPGSHAAQVVKGEREAIRSGMKQMAGAWLIVSPAGLRWAAAGTSLDTNMKSIKTALRNCGWNPPQDQLDALLASTRKTS